MSEPRTNNQEVKNRTPYTLTVQPEPFEPDCDMKFTTSSDFCKSLNEYFKAAFKDYIGSTFDVDQGFPTISLYFAHGKYDEGDVTAVQRADAKQSGSDIIDKLRTRDNMYKEGDRYVISEDGIDIIKPLLTARVYNYGNVNWKNIVTDIVDRSPMNYYQPTQQQQVTKIKGIDPRNICSILYGSKSEDGSSYIDYGIQVLQAMNVGNTIMPGNVVKNYVLTITRAYNGNLQKTYEKFGIVNAGSSIIR